MNGINGMNRWLGQTGRHTLRISVLLVACCCAAHAALVERASQDDPGAGPTPAHASATQAQRFAAVTPPRC